MRQYLENRRSVVQMKTVGGTSKVTISD